MILFVRYMDTFWRDRNTVIYIVFSLFKDQKLKDNVSVYLVWGSKIGDYYTHIHLSTIYMCVWVHVWGPLILIINICPISPLHKINKMMLAWIALEMVTSVCKTYLLMRALLSNKVSIIFFLLTCLVALICCSIWTRTEHPSLSRFLDIELCSQTNDINDKRICC